MTKEERYLARSIVKTMPHDWRPNESDVAHICKPILLLLYKFDLIPGSILKTTINNIYLIIQSAEPYLKEVRKSRGKLKPKTRRKRDEALRNITTD